MSTKNSFFRWKSTPAKCYDLKSLNLDQETCTFYTSFSLNDECYNLGEYVCVRILKETVIGRLLCMYETNECENQHRGVLRLYKFADDCDIRTSKKFNENEIIEDDVQKDVSLQKIKGKCTVILGTEHDILEDITPGTYLLRFKFLHSTLVPIFSDEAIKHTNVLNQFEKVLTPSCNITSKFEIISPSRVPYVKLCDSMKKARIVEKFATPKKLSVCRNLNESFDNAPNSQEGTPVLNYSLVENTADNEGDISLKIKLRLSQKQEVFIPIKKLDEDVFNKYLHKNKENVMVDGQCSVRRITRPKNRESVMDEAQYSVRRSTRPRQRISYVELNSPGITPIKRGRKKSTDIDKVIHSPIVSVLQEDLSNNVVISPSKRKIIDDESEFSKKITRSARKARNSDRDIQIDEIATDAINENNNSPCKITRSARKTRNSVKTLLKVDETDDFSPRKRKTTTPSRYRDYISSPMTIPKSILKQATTNVSTPRKSVYYKDDSDSASIVDTESPKKKRAIETSRTPKKSNNIAVAPTTPKTPIITLISKRTVKDTPNASDDSDLDLVDFQSPKKKRNTETIRTPRKSDAAPKTPKKQDTPSARAKLIREGIITPSIQSRATPVKLDKTPLNVAKSKLHVSYVPKILACREKEFNDVYNFVEGKLLDGCGGCMYISGVPGTGKTATVTEVIRKLQSHIKSRKIPDFEYVAINGMRLTEPRQSYVEILRQLTGKSVRWEQAQATLDAKFTKTGNKNKAIVLLVDELDILCTKRQDVVYNLLDWPTKAKAQLIVITIANTMDLPERLLMGRVTSRLGLTRLTFQAYTHKQLQEIVTRRLLGTDAFNPDAVQLVARKVASVSGDARRALDICRRAAEIAEIEGENTLVSMVHVNNALNAMITQPKVQAIKHCSRLQQLLLQAIVAEVERTGVEETSFADVYTMLISVAALDGFQMVTCTVALRAVSRLGACRLLLTDQKSYDFNQKLILNVSSDDVYYALRKD